jgi:hypothetical protein
MKPKFSAKHVLKKYVDEFTTEGLNLKNLGYLDFHLGRLERMQAVWEANSQDPQFSVRQRARSRDLSQCAQGLVNGIKFGISFIQHQDTDLDKALKEGLDKGVQQ